LKGANPEAFAIVQALLTKRSLGLLDPKHPTASMVAPRKEDAVERGPEAFANLAAPTSHIRAAEPAAAPQVELPYANVKATHHDWLNWKPQAAGADDAMVANALSMVGGMAGGASVAHVEAPVEAPEAPAPLAVESAPAQPASDWGSIGGMWGMSAKPHHKAAPVVATYEAAPQEAAQVAATKSKDWNSVEQTKQSGDDKAVSSLLNMVAQLKGKSAEKLFKKHHIAVVAENPLSKDENMFGDTPAEEAPEIAAPVIQQALPAVLPEAPVAAVAAAPEKESSWGSIGGMWGVHKKPHHMAAPVESAPVAYGHSSPYGLNWKPKSTEADQAMVANVLGMVGMKGGAAPAPEEAPAAVEEAPAPVASPFEEAAPAPRKEDKDEKAVGSLLKMVAEMKGGSAASKLLSKHQAYSEDGFSNDVPATPVAEESAPVKTDSWGSIGGMLGIHHRAAPVAPATPMAAAQSFFGGAIPSEVQSLISGNDRPVYRAAPPAPKTVDYKVVMEKKQNADDTAVKSLLSMVAQMKGSKHAAQLAEKYDRDTPEESQNPLASDANVFSDAAADAPAATQTAVVQEILEAPAAPVKSQNSWASLTSSLGAPEPEARHVAAPAQENSYLKGLDLTGDSERPKRTAFAKTSSKNFLSSFSWVDSEEDRPKPAVKAPTKSQMRLLSWLDPEAQTPKTAVAAKPQAPVNPYIADLTE